MNRALPLTFAALTLSTPAWAASTRQATPTPNARVKSAPSMRRIATRARLGVQALPMTNELRDYFGSPADRGVLVSRVVPDSPAAAAKIRAGDVITGVDGRPVDEVADVQSVLAEKKKGDFVPVTVVRDKKFVTLGVTVDTDPEPAHAGNAPAVPDRWLEEWRWPKGWGPENMRSPPRSFDELFEEMRRRIEQRSEKPRA